VKWVTTYAGLGSSPKALAFHYSTPHQAVVRFPSEADMRHTTITEQHGAYRTFVAEFWILAGVIGLLVLGDAVAVSAVTIAVVLAAWWIYREVEHRVESKHETTAPVTHLRPAFTGQPDPKKPAAHTSWHGPRAA
jgi:hypothetical protein